jgi:hypothetical protein
VPSNRAVRCCCYSQGHMCESLRCSTLAGSQWPHDSHPRGAYPSSPPRTAQTHTSYTSRPNSRESAYLSDSMRIMEERRHPSPQFRSEKEWKLTAGGMGMYSMNAPRSHNKTVTQVSFASALHACHTLSCQRASVLHACYTRVTLCHASAPQCYTLVTLVSHFVTSARLGVTPKSH